MLNFLSSFTRYNLCTQSDFSLPTRLLLFLLVPNCYWNHSDPWANVPGGELAHFLTDPMSLNTEEAHSSIVSYPSVEGGEWKIDLDIPEKAMVVKVSTLPTRAWPPNLDFISLDVGELW